MKYTAEEVRAMAKMVGDEFSPHAGSMLTAYAERIKADEGANDRIDFKGMWNAMSDRAYAHPPAQAAQSEDWRIAFFERARSCAGKGLRRYCCGDHCCTCCRGSGAG